MMTYSPLLKDSGHISLRMCLFILQLASCCVFGFTKVQFWGTCTLLVKSFNFKYCNILEVNISFSSSFLHLHLLFGRMNNNICLFFSDFKFWPDREGTLFVLQNIGIIYCKTENKYYRRVKTTSAQNNN